MEKSKNVVDKRRLLEEDEKLKRAEQDKLAAITALEQRSRTLMQEKKEKKKLEERIKHLQVVPTLARCHIPDVSHQSATPQDQLVTGGSDDLAAMHQSLQEEHSKVPTPHPASTHPNPHSN